MNCYKFTTESFFASLFILTVFLSDFGIVLAGQPIYFYQLLGFGFLIISVIHNAKIEKGWLLFFLASVIIIICNSTLLFEVRQFAGDTYPRTSIKAFVNIILFYAVYKTATYSYYKINPNLFLYLSLFMILYGFIELLFGTNTAVKEVLSILHTNPKALEKESLSLLGREHSYGAFGFLFAAAFLIYFHFHNSFNGLKKIICICSILILIMFVVIAKAKSMYIAILLLIFVISYLISKERKLSITSIFLIFSSLITLTYVVIYVITHNFFNDALESVSGEVGSGSTFIRWVNLRVAWAIFCDNILLGVGPGNYKLFYVEYVEILKIPKILELKTLTDPNYKMGSIDPSNFFAGILSEFGLITFLAVYYILYKRIKRIISITPKGVRNVSLSLILLPIVFAASLGFYYWAISFFPLFLAVLHVEYKNLRGI
jgi:hypothetical protein